MAGHSKWANIKHRKDKQDKRRAGAFTRLGRELIVAARAGADPEFNPRLRVAVQAAKALNMPRDRIDYAIKKGSGQLDDGQQFEEMRYEAYAPGGVALIIEALTDNRNRSASDIRTLLSKAGGNLGESGSVAFMFDRIGLIQYPASAATNDAMFEAALEAGAADCSSEGEVHEITMTPEDFPSVRDVLVKKFGDPEAAKLSWKPKVTVPVDFEVAQQVLNLIDALEEHEDVQAVSANYDIADDVADKLQAVG